MPSTPLLKMPAAAEHLGITHRHLRELVTRREIPFHKVGRLVMFDKDDLANWLAANRVEAVD